MSHLEGWSLVGNGSLQGEIHHDERFPDGHCIRTSPVVELNLEEHYAITASGTRYSLGKLHINYFAWLIANNIHLTSFKKDIKGGILDAKE